MSEMREAVELARKIEAWVRHGEAVPADVTTYERWIVNTELRDIIAPYLPIAPAEAGEVG